jgi:hypothetical protein
MSCRIICAAFPYLVVSGDDMGKRTAEGSAGKASSLPRTPQEVIEAIFGKPSGNVVSKGAGTI